jgi:hypothetical protein
MHVERRLPFRGRDIRPVFVAIALDNPYRNLRRIFAKRKIYLTAFLDHIGSQQRMLDLHFLQRQLKIVCRNIAVYSCRHYAIDGRLAIDIHESLEEEHFPFHGSFFFPAANIRQVMALPAFRES